MMGPVVKDSGCALPGGCAVCVEFDPRTLKCDKGLTHVADIKTAPTKSVWDTQVGGNHYTSMKIQPFQYSMANKLDPMQHTIVKYVSRFRAKNGIQDLEKAKQTIDLLIQWEKDNAQSNSN